MADFFREVEEDYRREQLIRFWQQYQGWIIAAAVLIVLGTGAWRVYDYFRLKSAETAGARYQAALQLVHDGKNAEAVKAFDAIAKDAPHGYAMLAMLSAANALVGKDPKAAAAAYDRIAADPSVEKPFQDVARLRGAYLRVDSDTPKQFAERYMVYAGPDSPYRDAYRELLALADTRSGNFKDAAHWLELASEDPAAPPALRGRADAFLSIVQSGAVPTK